MMMNQTIRTASHRQTVAATMTWQPSACAGTGSFIRLSSLSLNPVAGYSLRGQFEKIEGSTVKNDRTLKS
jgi:hypothetical protein